MNGEARICLNDEERRRILRWADSCSSESKMYDDDVPLLTKLGGSIDGPFDGVVDVLRSQEEDR